MRRLLAIIALACLGVLGAGATREQVWSYLGNYVADADPAAHPALDGLVGKALAYNRDFIAPTLVRRKPEPAEAAFRSASAPAQPHRVAQRAAPATQLLGKARTKVRTRG